MNIQRKLRERGVDLRRDYPHVYDQLIAYVADGKHFPPLIIYPYDVRLQKRFMCVVMPESEPEIEWIQYYDLFDELDITDVNAGDSLSTDLSDIAESPV